MIHSIMKSALIACAILFFVATQAQQLPGGGKIWAVLVAGTNGYSYYRQQADICHAYQVLHDHGVPDEQIIVMMYDDIADNVRNPTPGVIINKPDGPNVYDGVPKDYVKSSVNPNVFKSVLTGDVEGVEGKGSGKVLKSGPKDNVFIAYAGLGSRGEITFPEGELSADELVDILNSMHQANTYSKLTLYVDASFAGSMFTNLPQDINAYATAATDARGESYATYYSPEYDTYLGDLFSVSWAEDSDVEDLKVETLSDQYATVKNRTQEKQVPAQYGDLSIAKDPVGDFQGTSKSPTSRHIFSAQKRDAVRADNVHLEILKRKLVASKTDEETAKITSEIQQLFFKREQFNHTVKAIVQMSVAKSVKAEAVFNLTQNLAAFYSPCYTEVLKYFSKKCYPLSQNLFALRHVHIFANICELKVNPRLVKAAMDKICISPITNVN